MGTDKKGGSRKGIYKRGRPRKGDPPKDASGLYRMREGKESYFGKGMPMSSRIAAHRRDGKFGEDSETEYQVAHQGDLSNEEFEKAILDHEDRKIEQHKPSLNKRSGGGGRRRYPKKDG